MRLTINNFSGGVDANLSGDLARLSRANLAYNFDFLGGLLTSSGLFETEIEGNLTESGVLDNLFMRDDGGCSGALFLYRRYDEEEKLRDDKLVIFDENYKGYYISLESADKKIYELGVNFTSLPVAVCYKLMGKDVIILSSPTDNMVVWDGVSAPEIIADAPVIGSMAIHYERLFAVCDSSPNVLRFSDELDPTNWSESLDDAGFIEFSDERGALKKVISFNDYLYVFRERGITRVYANVVDTSSFYVNHLFTAGGSIFDKTITLCGDKIIFVATDGFYLFDGSSTVRRLDNIFKLIEVNDFSCGVYQSGKYYLSCKLKAKGSKVNDLIVEIDTETLSYKFIYGKNFVYILDFSVGDSSKLMALVAGDENFLQVLNPGATLDDNKPLQAFYRSGLSNIESSKVKKILRKVKVCSLGDVKITFFNEAGEEECVEASGGGYFETAVFFPFEKIGMQVEAEAAGAKLEEVTIEFN